MAATRPLDYVQIPPGATLLLTDSRIVPKSTTRLPKQSSLPYKPKSTSIRPDSPSPAPSVPSSPSSLGATHRRSSSFTNHVLTQVLNLPSPPPQPINPSKAALLSHRDPLSLPITTTNFRRFVARSGAIFWIQDRAEEILFWRRDWSYTTAFLCGYAFLCIFPNLLIALPPAVLLAIVLANKDDTHVESEQLLETSSIPPFPSSPAEGSSQWFNNVQAIQNVLGAASDGYDFLALLVIHLQSTPQNVTPLVIVTIILVLLGIIIPLRYTLLFIGVAPFILSHPFVRPYLPLLVTSYSKSAQAKLREIADDDKLEDRHWLHTSRKMRQVELWENERWDDEKRIWTKACLREGERRAWTRGADGWSSINQDGEVSSSLTFMLEPGWVFVETEDWKEDLFAAWADFNADENGWVYTNDAWQRPRSQPAEDWLLRGATRRRRWIRRIYYNIAFGNGTDTSSLLT